MKAIEKALQCSICLETMLNPHYTKYCSHKFCKSCLVDLLRLEDRTQRRCPLCREQFNSLRDMVEDKPFGDVAKAFRSIQQSPGSNATHASVQITTDADVVEDETQVGANALLAIANSPVMHVSPAPPAAKKVKVRHSHSPCFRCHTCNGFKARKNLKCGNPCSSDSRCPSGLTTLPPYLFTPIAMNVEEEDESAN